MLSQYLTPLINKYLDPYIDDLDHEQLQISLLKGDVLLRNLHLKKDALREFLLPIDLITGTIDLIHIRLNLASLLSSNDDAAMIVELAGIHLTVRPRHTFDKEYEYQSSQQKSSHQSRLDAIRDRHIQQQATLQQHMDQLPDTLTWTDRIVAKMIQKMRLKIDDVHIRYQDTSLSPSIAMGFGFSSLTVESTDKTASGQTPEMEMDKNGKPKPGRVMKLIALNGACAYLCTNDVEEEETLSLQQKLASFAGISLNTENTEESPTPLLLSSSSIPFLLRPTDINIHLSLPTRDLKPGQAKMVAVVQCHECAVDINEDQILMLQQIGDTMTSAMKRIAAVKRQVAETWRMGTAADRERYIELYKRSLNAEWLKKLNKEEEEELKEMDHDIIFNDLALYRTLAFAELTREMASHHPVTQRSKDEHGHSRTVGKVEHFWSKLIFAQVKPKKDTDEPVQSQAHATMQDTDIHNEIDINDASQKPKHESDLDDETKNDVMAQIQADLEAELEEMTLPKHAIQLDALVSLSMIAITFTTNRGDVMIRTLIPHIRIQALKYPLSTYKLQPSEIHTTSTQHGEMEGMGPAKPVTVAIPTGGMDVSVDVPHIYLTISHDMTKLKVPSTPASKCEWLKFDFAELHVMAELMSNDIGDNVSTHATITLDDISCRDCITIHESMRYMIYTDNTQRNDTSMNESIPVTSYQNSLVARLRASGRWSDIAESGEVESKSEEPSTSTSTYTSTSTPFLCLTFHQTRPSITTSIHNANDPNTSTEAQDVDERVTSAPTPAGAHVDIKMRRLYITYNPNTIASLIRGICMSSTLIMDGMKPKSSPPIVRASPSGRLSRREQRWQKHRKSDPHVTSTNPAITHRYTNDHDAPHAYDMHIDVDMEGLTLTLNKDGRHHPHIIMDAHVDGIKVMMKQCGPTMCLRANISQLGVNSYMSSSHGIPIISMSKDASLLDVKLDTYASHLPAYPGHDLALYARLASLHIYIRPQDMIQLMDYINCSLTDVMSDVQNKISTATYDKLTFIPIDTPPTPTSTIKSLADKLSKAAPTITTTSEPTPDTTVIVNETLIETIDPITHTPVQTKTVVTDEIERKEKDGMITESKTTTTTVTTRKKRSAAADMVETESDVDVTEEKENVNVDVDDDEDDEMDDIPMSQSTLAPAATKDQPSPLSKKLVLDVIISSPIIHIPDGTRELMIMTGDIIANTHHIMANTITALKSIVGDMDVGMNEMELKIGGICVSMIINDVKHDIIPSTPITLHAWHPLDLTAWKHTYPNESQLFAQVMISSLDVIITPTIIRELMVLQQHITSPVSSIAPEEASGDIQYQYGRISASTRAAKQTRDEVTKDMQQEWSGEKHKQQQEEITQKQAQEEGKQNIPLSVQLMLEQVSLLLTCRDNISQQDNTSQQDKTSQDTTSRDTQPTISHQRSLDSDRVIVTKHSSDDDIMAAFIAPSPSDKINPQVSISQTAATTIPSSTSTSSLFLPQGDLARFTISAFHARVAMDKDSSIWLTASLDDITLCDERDVNAPYKYVIQHDRSKHEEKEDTESKASHVTSSSSNVDGDDALLCIEIIRHAGPSPHTEITASLCDLTITLIPDMLLLIQPFIMIPMTEAHMYVENEQQSHPSSHIKDEMKQHDDIKRTTYEKQTEEMKKSSPNATSVVIASSTPQTATILMDLIGVRIIIPCDTKKSQSHGLLLSLNATTQAQYQSTSIQHEQMSHLNLNLSQLCCYVLKDATQSHLYDDDMGVILRPCSITLDMEQARPSPAGTIRPTASPHVSQRSIISQSSSHHITSHGRVAAVKYKIASPTTSTTTIQRPATPTSMYHDDMGGYHTIPSSMATPSLATPICIDIDMMISPIDLRICYEDVLMINTLIQHMTSLQSQVSSIIPQHVDIHDDVVPDVEKTEDIPLMSSPSDAVTNAVHYESVISFTLRTARLAVVVIDDCLGRWTPLISLAIPSITCAAGVKHQIASCLMTIQLEANYYEITTSVWERLLFPLTIALEARITPTKQLSMIHGKQSHPVAASILFVNEVELRITHSFLRNIMHTINTWTEDMKMNDIERYGENGIKRGAPLFLYNDTGVGIRYWLHDGSIARPVTSHAAHTMTPLRSGERVPLWTERISRIQTHTQPHTRDMLINIELDGDFGCIHDVDLTQLGVVAYPLIRASDAQAREAIEKQAAITATGPQHVIDESVVDDTSLDYLIVDITRDVHGQHAIRLYSSVELINETRCELEYDVTYTPFHVHTLTSHAGFQQENELTIVERPKPQTQNRRLHGLSHESIYLPLDVQRWSSIAVRPVGMSYTMSSTLSYDDLDECDQLQGLSLEQRRDKLSKMRDTRDVQGMIRSNHATHHKKQKPNANVNRIASNLYQLVSHNPETQQSMYFHIQFQHKHGIMSMLPSTSMRILAPMQLLNAFPYDITFRIIYHSQKLPSTIQDQHKKSQQIPHKEQDVDVKGHILVEGTLKAGESASLHNIDFLTKGHYTLQFRIGPYSYSSPIELDLSGEFIPTRDLHTTLHDQIRGDPITATIHIQDREHDARLITCFADYWIINHLDIPIMYEYGKRAVDMRRMVDDGSKGEKKMGRRGSTSHIPHVGPAEDMLIAWEHQRHNDQGWYTVKWTDGDMKEIDNIASLHAPKGWMFVDDEWHHTHHPQRYEMAKKHHLGNDGWIYTMSAWRPQPAKRKRQFQRRLQKCVATPLICDGISLHDTSEKDGKLHPMVLYLPGAPVSQVIHRTKDGANVNHCVEVQHTPDAHGLIAQTDVGVSFSNDSAPGIFAHTKVMTLNPRYVMVNAGTTTFNIIQSCVGRICTSISPGQETALHWIDHKTASYGLISINPDPTIWHDSPPFPINRVGRFIVANKRSALAPRAANDVDILMWHVTIELRDVTLVCTFTQESLSHPSYVLDNRSSYHIQYRQAISFTQSSRPKIPNDWVTQRWSTWSLLEANTVIPYAWDCYVADQPYRMEVRLPTTEMKDDQHVVVTLDDVTSYASLPHTHGKIHIYMIHDGTSCILRVSDTLPLGRHLPDGRNVAYAIVENKQEMEITRRRSLDETSSRHTIKTPQPRRASVPSVSTQKTISQPSQQQTEDKKHVMAQKLLDTLLTHITITLPELHVLVVDNWNERRNHTPIPLVSCHLLGMKLLMGQTKTAIKLDVSLDTLQIDNATYRPRIGSRTDELQPASIKKETHHHFWSRHKKEEKQEIKDETQSVRFPVVLAITNVKPVERVVLQEEKPKALVPSIQLYVSKVIATPKPQTHIITSTHVETSTETTATEECFEYVIAHVNSPIFVQIEEEFVMKMINFAQSFTPPDRSIPSTRDLDDVTTIADDVTIITTLLHQPVYTPVIANKDEKEDIPANKTATVQPLYIKSLHLPDLQIIVSVETQKYGHTGLVSLSGMSHNNVGYMSLVNLVRSLGNLEQARVHISDYTLSHQHVTPQPFKDQLVKHYQNQIIVQVLKLAGSLAVIGNPVGVVGAITSSASEALTRPAESFSEGEFGDLSSDVLVGTTGFASTVVGAPVTAVGGITKSVGNTLTTVTDDRFNRKRHRDLNKRSKNVIQGLGRGAKAFGRGVVSGVTGLVKQPMKYGKVKGAKGVAEGILRGIVALPAKIAIGALDAVTHVSSGVAGNVGYAPIPQPIWMARLMDPDQVVVPRDADPMAPQHMYTAAIPSDPEQVIESTLHESAIQDEKEAAIVKQMDDDDVRYQAIKRQSIPAVGGHEVTSHIVAGDAEYPTLSRPTSEMSANKASITINASDVSIISSKPIRMDASDSRYSSAQRPSNSTMDSSIAWVETSNLHHPSLSPYDPTSLSYPSQSVQ